MISRAQERVALAGALLVAAPTLLAFYPPMTDLPLHEGMIGALLHHADEAWFPRDLLVLNLGHSNQLVYFVGWVLGHLVGTRWAMKLIVAAAQAGVVLGGARTARHLGRTPVVGLLLAPLALGGTFYWGLVTNLVGLACLLWTLPTLDTAAREPTRRSALNASAAMLLLFLAHESAVLVACGVLVVLMVAARPRDTRRDVRTWLLAASPVVVGAAIVAAHHAWSRALVTEGMIAATLETTPVGQRITTLPRALFGAHDTEGLVLASVACVLGIGGEVVSGGRPKPSRPFLVAAAVMFALYLAFPSAYGTMMLLHHRFLGPAWALLVLGLAPPQPKRAVAVAASSLVPVAMLVLAAPQYADAHRAHEDVALLLARIPKDSAVTVVVPDGPGDRRRAYSTATAPSRSLAVLGGRAGLSLSISEYAPVQIRPDLRWDELDRRLLGQGTLALRPSYDLTRFGWVLARTPDQASLSLLARAFGEDAAPVALEGEWTLFRSTHAVVPVDTPEAAVPPGADTLRDRLKRLATTRAQ